LNNIIYVYYTYCANDGKLSTTLDGYQFILAASRPQPWKAYNRPNFTILLMTTPRSELITKKALTTTMTTTLCLTSDRYSANIHYKCVLNYGDTLIYAFVFVPLTFDLVFLTAVLYLLDVTKHILLANIASDFIIFK
jgi:hypothetical protein